MDAGRPCATAMAVAVSRGSHRADDEPPWPLRAVAGRASLA
jgi:hypothetical protein